MAMTLTVMTVSAQTFTVDNADGVTINYSVISADNHTVSVGSYNYSGRVIVPDTVLYNDVAWTVTSIGTAFKGKDITFLGVPATVTTLEVEALANCHQLDTLWLASETPVLGPMVGGLRRPERVFFTNSQTPSLYVGVAVVVPCGSLKNYRDNSWDRIPTLTSTCAVPITVITTVDSIYCLDSIIYRDGNQNRVHFSNCSYEVGDTARVMAQRLRIRQNWNTYTPRYGWFIGWEDGSRDLDRSFVVTHADTLYCIVDTFHYATLSASRITTPVYQFGTLSYDGEKANYSFPDLAHNAVQQRYEDGNIVFDTLDILETPSSVYATALWVGSRDSLDYNREYWQVDMDSSAVARVATARFFAEGTDYYPGPLRMVDATTDLQTVMDFNRVWHVTRDMIDYHIEHYSNNGYTPVDDILTWPGNGPEGYATQLAPYFDADSDGIYNPLHGDYPLIRGDECVFSIFNDAYGSHSESQGKSLGIEVHAMTYAFNEPSDTALWNTVFVHYDIYNRSAASHPNTFFGAWSDFDLGYGNDDFMGCDVKRGMYYAYNGKSEDGPGTGSFQGNPPAQGCMILGGATLPADGQDNPKINLSWIQACGSSYLQQLLENYRRADGTIDTSAVSRDAELFFGLDYHSWYFIPGDTLGNMSLNGLNFGDGIADNERFGMTSYLYYENSISSISGEPTIGNDYYNYMHSCWKNNTHVKFGGNGYSWNVDVYDARFMFPDDSDPWRWGTDGMEPSINPNDWNEITVDNNPGDRRGVAGSGPFTFAAGSCQQFDLAFTTGFGDSTTWSSVEALRLNTDNVRRQFVRDTTDSDRPFTYRPDVPEPIPGPGTDTTGISNIEAPVLDLWPNPTSGMLTVSLEGSNVRELQLLDLYGRTLLRVPVNACRNVDIDLSDLPQGIYILCAGAYAHRVVKR